MTPIERRGFLLNWWDQLLKTPTLQLSPVGFQSFDPVPCFKIIPFQAAIIQRAVQTQATRSDQADEIHFPFQWSCFCQREGRIIEKSQREWECKAEKQNTLPGLLWYDSIGFESIWQQEVWSQIIVGRHITTYIDNSYWNIFNVGHQNIVIDSQPHSVCAMRNDAILTD